MKRSIIPVLLCLYVLLFCACGSTSQSSSVDFADAVDALMNEVATLEDVSVSQAPQRNTTDDAPPAEPSPSPFVEPEYTAIGEYTLSECQANPGLYILHSDGSFSKYYTGHVLYWNEQPMTYGTDPWPEDLVISNWIAQNNIELLEQGQLVLFFPYDDRVLQGLYPVTETGYTLGLHDSDLNLVCLFHTLNSTNAFSKWTAGETFYWSNVVDCTTINGINSEDYVFPSTEGRDFSSFPPGEEYTIGIVTGTTLEEETYNTDYTYFLHDEESVDYKLNATPDGYAVFDFSDTPVGEYVFTISYWNSTKHTRKVWSTNINVSEKMTVATGDAEPDIVITDSNWKSFLANKSYLNYWDTETSSPSEYAQIDIDGDGVEEMIILGSEGSGFYNYLLFSYNDSSNTIEPLCFDSSVSSSNIRSCYGQMRYSSQFNALSTSAFKPFSECGDITYYCKDDTTMTQYISVGWGTDSSGLYYYAGTDRITEEEKDQYIEELTTINFLELP